MVPKGQKITIYVAYRCDAMTTILGRFPLQSSPIYSLKIKTSYFLLNRLLVDVCDQESDMFRNL